MASTAAASCILPLGTALVLSFLDQTEVGFLDAAARAFIAEYITFLRSFVVALKFGMHAFQNVPSYY